MTQEPNQASSDSARQATGNEMQGIINFFKKQLQAQQNELQKYIRYKDVYHLPFAQNAIDITTQHITQTTEALAQYEQLLTRYQSEGRA